MPDGRLVLSVITLLAVTVACSVTYVWTGVTAYRNLATVCMAVAILGAGYFFGRQDGRHEDSTDSTEPSETL